MYFLRHCSNTAAFFLFFFLVFPKVYSQDIDYILLTVNNPDTLQAIAGQLFADNKEKDALKVVIKAQKEYDKLGNIDAVLDMSIAKSSIYFRLGRYNDYRKQISEIESFEIEQLDYSLKTRANLFSALALNNKTKGNIDKAIYYYEKSIEIDHATGDTKNLISSYINLGQYSSLNNEISRAEKYYTAAIHLADSNLENEYRDGQKTSIQNSLGKLYLDEKDYNKALAYFSMNLDQTFSAHPLLSEHKIGALINRAKAHLYLSQYTDMDRDLFLAEELITNSSLHQFRSKILEVRAKAFTRRSEFENAINLYVKINKQLTDLYGKNTRNIDIMMNDLNIALTYQDLAQHESAVLYFKKIVSQITNYKSSDSTIQNLKEIENAPFSYLLLQSLNGYAESQFELYERTQSHDHLEESYYAYNFTIQAISKTRADYNDYTSKLNLSINSNSIFEKTIETSLLLYEFRHDVQYLLNAFKSSEKNRASLLSEAINENRALKNGALPDTLLEEEKNLRLQISSTNKQLHELKMLDEEKEVKLKELYLFELQNELSRLKKKIEVRYPTYYNIKFRQNEFDIGKIQSRLKKQNTVLLEYFIGENNFYIFYLDGDKISYKSQKLDNQLLSAAEALIQFTSNPPQFASLATDFILYINNAHLLFSELMEPFYTHTDKNILIIPDGFLNYVPFDGLITSLPSSNDINFSMRNVPYLLNEHNISYHYSAQLFSESRKEGEQNSTGVNAFAPSFRSLDGQTTSTCSNQNSLQELKCNTTEVESIKELIPDTKTFTDKAANLNSFQSNHKGSSILHIASHACINPSDPNFNKIFFVDDYLSNNDIFNLDLSTELVVLSACETGGGKFVIGEGVMSLAKGFLQAGSQSVLMSLWSVDDCITAKQIKSFYINLLNGDTKCEALRFAKIQHLESSNKDKLHPYYWSPLVIIGNDNPVIFNEAPNPLILYSILIFCAFLALVFFFKSK